MFHRRSKFFSKISSRGVHIFQNISSGGNQFWGVHFCHDSNSVSGYIQYLTGGNFVSKVSSGDPYFQNISSGGGLICHDSTMSQDMYNTSLATIVHSRLCNVDCIVHMQPFQIRALIQIAIYLL